MRIVNLLFAASVVNHRSRPARLALGVSSTNELDVTFTPGVMVYAEYRGAAGRWSPELESYVRSVMREEGDEVVSIMGPDLLAAAMYGLLHADLAAIQERLSR
jgi:hypothetical protein